MDGKKKKNSGLVYLIHCVMALTRVKKIIRRKGIVRRIGRQTQQYRNSSRFQVPRPHSAFCKTLFGRHAPEIRNICEKQEYFLHYQNAGTVISGPIVFVQYILFSYTERQFTVVGLRCKIESQYQPLLRKDMLALNTIFSEYTSVMINTFPKFCFCASLVGSRLFKQSSFGDKVKKIRQYNRSTDSNITLYGHQTRSLLPGSELFGMLTDCEL